eukprot:TRINITY_DN4853_c0_g1_i1.p1 TRINITY_DN4853_c0_g1~~TRINITY_DN4853_c0_g1_i1.p1  ORF type:complete len:523 (-),score=77.36 TRINITY_DN4853_c0_g1_i1:789-2357(-)
MARAVPLFMPLSLCNPEATAASLKCERCRSNNRDVKAQAGRSKKKAGKQSSSPSGRIEGRGEERKAFRLMTKSRKRLKVPVFGDETPTRKQSFEKHPFYTFLYEEGQQERELTEKEKWLLGLTYERVVRFASGPDDPDLRDPMDWYKYGPYSPHARKPLPALGKLVRGRPGSLCAQVFTTLESREEYEYIPIHDSIVEYDRALDDFEKENVSLRYFWTFARGFKRVEPRLKPWDEWTLVCQLAVEDRPSLDKYHLGRLIGKKARDFLGRCTSWFRPDLTFVKKPYFQLRFEPQEEFFQRLVHLIDPLTEKRSNFEVFGEVGTYYECFCRVLGILLDADDDNAVKAFEKLDKEQKSLCLEFVFSNHPVNLFHLFSKGWKDGENKNFQGEEEDCSEEEAFEEDKELQTENEDFAEVDRMDDEFTKQSSYWEKEMERALRGLEKRNFFDGTAEDVEKFDSRDEHNQEEMEDSVEPEEGQSDNSVSDFVRSAARPFTYSNFIREIVLLRQELLELRRSSDEPIKLF